MKIIFIRHLLTESNAGLLYDFSVICILLQTCATDMCIINFYLLYLLSCKW